MNTAHIVVAMVLYITRPRSAPDVDDDAVSESFKPDHHERRTVTLLIAVRVVVAWEAVLRPIGKRPDVLLIYWILTITRNTYVRWGCPIA